jgi:mannose-1-phosphate guanylyltransferase
MEKVIALEVGQPGRTCPTSTNRLEGFETVSIDPIEVKVQTNIAPVTQEHLWAIVLAGGEGERLRPLTEKWLGCHCPKQYCTFVGDRTMLEHTLERTCRIVHPDHVLTVVSCEHMRWLESSVVRSIPGHVIKQPANLDTAPGIFLPATYILAKDSAATILIFPSDHFVFPQKRFTRRIGELVEIANRFNDQIVMLGAKPDRAESDYGWIEVGESCAPSLGDNSRDGVRRISAFREKPSSDEAFEFLEKGYLWNTMIMAVKAETLWQLGHEYFPEMIELFELLKSALSKDNNEDGTENALASIYQRLRPQNFSRGLLQRAIGHTLVVPMEDVDWDDWGRPERIVASLARIGLRPAFSTESITSGSKKNAQNTAIANA